MRGGYSAAKTVADGFKYRAKLGVKAAVEALRDALADVFRDACGFGVPNDGLAFAPASVQAEPHRSGVRRRATVDRGPVARDGRLRAGRRRLRPRGRPGRVPDSVLTDQPRPRLRVYPMAAVVAETVHAIVTLSMPNTRMKDYFDRITWRPGFR